MTDSATQSNAAADINPVPLGDYVCEIVDNVTTGTLTLRANGHDYKFHGRAANMIRAARALYAQDAGQSAAFIRGLLLLLVAKDAN